MSKTAGNLSVAFVVPHETGCVDTHTGDVYPTVEAVKNRFDRVVFTLTD